MIYSSECVQCTSADCYKFHDRLHLLYSAVQPPFPPLTIAPHPAGEALLQTAILTSVAVVLRDLAIHRATALIAQLLPDGPLEEALASFAADGAIVTAARPIAAD